jgi:hypothetical protein
LLRKPKSFIVRRCPIEKASVGVDHEVSGHLVGTPMQKTYQIRDISVLKQVFRCTGFVEVKDIRNSKDDPKKGRTNDLSIPYRNGSRPSRPVVKVPFTVRSGDCCHPIRFEAGKVRRQPITHKLRTELVVAGTGVLTPTLLLGTALPCKDAQ